MTDSSDPQRVKDDTGSHPDEQISPEDVDKTVTNLQDGVRNLVLDRAVAEISGWIRKLETTGEADLEAVAEDLFGLREELENGMGAGGVDRVAVGEILAELGSKVQSISENRGTSTGSGIEEKLKKLGGVLANQGASISEQRESN